MPETIHCIYTLYSPNTASKFPWSCPWFCSAKSSFLKYLASSFQNCFTSSAHHRLALSPHIHQIHWICPQDRSSLPMELQPQAISLAAQPLIPLPSLLRPSSNTPKHSHKHKVCSPAHNGGLAAKIFLLHHGFGASLKAKFWFWWCKQETVQDLPNTNNCSILKCQTGKIKEVLTLI